MTPVNVGLRGYDRRNLGSHLMAISAVDRLAPATVSIPLRATNLGRPEAPAGTGHWLWTELGGPPVLHQVSSTVFGPTSRVALGATGPMRVGGVIDISGYMYGDPFGMGPVRRLGDWARRWAADGLPLVLLPQSIGPFHRPEDRAEMRRALQHVRLTIVRDDHSEELVHALDASCTVMRSPDLAIESARLLARRPHPSTAGRGRPYAVFLPNRQVHRKLDVDKGTYVQLLAKGAQLCSDAGLDVVVAAHEQGSDDPLCAAVAAAVPGSRVLAVTTAQGMVAAVRDAAVVVSSRFHGLVAALANGVPGVALGWASKYDDLLGEFEVPDLSLSLDRDNGQGELADLLRTVLDERTQLSKGLAERAAELQRQLDDMWAVVLEVLASRPR